MLKRPSLWPNVSYRLKTGESENPFKQYISKLTLVILEWLEYIEWPY